MWTGPGGTRARPAQPPAGGGGEPGPGFLANGTLVNGDPYLTDNTVYCVVCQVWKVQIATAPVATKGSLGGPPPRCADRYRSVVSRRQIRIHRREGIGPRTIRPLVRWGRRRQGPGRLSGLWAQAVARARLRARSRRCRPVPWHSPPDGGVAMPPRPWATPESARGPGAARAGAGGGQRVARVRTTQEDQRPAASRLRARTVRVRPAGTARRW